jgi:hypothetical protein
MESWIDKRSSFTNDEPMIKEARVSKMWIYCKSKKKWYTPEEFEELVKNRNPNDEGYIRWLSDFVIRDPIDGLKDRINVLKTLHQEMERYTEKMFSYFKLK